MRHRGLAALLGTLLVYRRGGMTLALHDDQAHHLVSAAPAG